MRLNNLSARLIVNKKLEAIGFKRLPAELSYLEFATKLREMIAPRQTQCEFTERSDAVAYIRWASKSIFPVDI